MSDWKDLEIGNIPSDFFVNERYVVEAKINHMTEKWATLKIKPNSRYGIIEKMQEDIKYRYRLKPLESMKVTRNELSKIQEWISDDKSFNDFISKNGVVTELFGRKVEIIEE